MADLESQLQGITDDLAPVEHGLWALAIATAGLDVLLTYAGLQMGLSEGNPLVASIIADEGILALLAIKSVLLGLAVLGRRWRPTWGPWLPLGLALPWLVATGINATLLAMP